MRIHRHCIYNHQKTEDDVKQIKSEGKKQIPDFTHIEFIGTNEQTKN